MLAHGNSPCRKGKMTPKTTQGNNTGTLLIQTGVKKQKGGAVVSRCMLVLFSSAPDLFARVRTPADMHWTVVVVFLVSELQSKHMAAAGAAAGPSGARPVVAAFWRVYDEIKAELLRDPSFEFNDDAVQWLDRMLDYNVLGGKLNRGLAVVESFKLLKDGAELSEDEVFLACILGWGIEWLQACFLVLDDIMDNSQTRRGKPCWHRLPKVGLIAINDGLVLRSQISRIFRRYFFGKPYHIDLLDLFNEVEFQTTSGQLLDQITTNEGQMDLNKYTVDVHRHIIEYKTAYYSCYLPVACALLLAGENLNNYVEVKKILIEMGVYFQIQDDYLDCFGDPEAIGKIGTDIEDFKCSWLIVQAIQRADERQKGELWEIRSCLCSKSEGYI